MWLIDDLDKLIEKKYSCESCIKRNTCTKKEYSKDCHEPDKKVLEEIREEALRKVKTFLLFIPPEEKRNIVNFIFLILFTLLVFVLY